MLELQLSSIVCGLAAAVFAACARRAAAERVLAAAALTVVTLSLGSERSVDPSASAAAIAAAALLVLLRPTTAERIAGALAGAGAGLWAASLAAQGAPHVPAALLALGLLALTMWLTARDRAFARPVLREEALLILAALGILLALGPRVAEGWRAAVALRAQPLARPDQPSSVWVFVVAGACVLVGVLYAVWRQGKQAR